MKKLIYIYSVLLIAQGCAHQSGGFYNRENKNTYSVMVGGAVNQPKYSLQRGVYSICKKNHKHGGYEILKNDWKYGDMGSSSIEARVKCTGEKDDFLDNKFKNDPNKYIETKSHIDRYEREFQLTP
jgi:hypothetical protein